MYRLYYVSLLFDAQNHRVGRNPTENVDDAQSVPPLCQNVFYEKLSNRLVKIGFLRLMLVKSAAPLLACDRHDSESAAKHKKSLIISITLAVKIK